jgi:hypothetical protein
VDLDILCRAGRFDSAEQFINKMEQPDLVTWITFLSACRNFKDVSRAQYAATKALTLDPKNASVFVLLANTYAMTGNFEMRDKVRAEMEARGIKKNPGQCWIFNRGVQHMFHASEDSHPLMPDIKREAAVLVEQVKRIGYKADSTWVLRHKEDDHDKEVALCEHSERLALVYGLLEIPSPNPITIFNNLRMCGDCHDFTSKAAVARKREIRVRDTSRWHIFVNGKCSCNDYF